MRSRFPAIALVCLFVAGCGSTVQEQGLTTGAGANGGLGGPSTGGAAGTNYGGNGNGLSAPGATSGSGTTGATSGSGAGAGPATGGAGTTSTGTGTAAPTGGNVISGDRTPIKVGFEVIQGGNEFIAQGLGTPVNFGDGKLEIKAIVNDVNKHGGINGHPIEPFYASWNPASGATGRQADCTQLTEDDHVNFILTVINIEQALLACAAKHNVPVINSSLGSGDDYMYAQYPQMFYSPSMVSLNSELSLVMNTGRASGRIDPSKKLGVVVDANPNADPKQYDRVLKTTVEPTLNAWHIPYETTAIATTSDVDGAVLKFRADNVKSVIFIAPSGIIEILFMEDAENQKYRPDYVFGDSSSAWFVGEAAPPAQVQHITGAGSLPLGDVPASQYPTTPRERHCLDIIRSAGESNRDRQSSITATVYCEAIYEFAAIAARVTGSLSPASFAAAFPKVGTTYQPVTTFGVDFGTGRHTNASLYRLLGYTSKCQCISYTSGVRPIG